ncbi:hypothetical protein [Micromonospora sp. NPDC048830]|uniref:hypothetical protein n=1 Tax=Micromonospora sp. NPDC048830 TaxID=3364257 RepID=UPI00371AED50
MPDQPEVAGVRHVVVDQAGGVEPAVAAGAGEHEPVVADRVAHLDVGAPPDIPAGAPVDDGLGEAGLAVAGGPDVHLPHVGAGRHPHEDRDGRPERGLLVGDVRGGAVVVR